MECQFCKNTFNTNSALKQHQKTAKYCLKIRGINNNEYKCTSCDKTFSNNYNLSVHLVSCNKSKISLELKSKLDNTEAKLQKCEYMNEQKDIQINNLQDQIKYLQDKLINVTLKAVENKNNDIQWVEEIMNIGDEENTCYKKLKEENKDIKEQIKYLIK